MEQFAWVKIFRYLCNMRYIDKIIVHCSAGSQNNTAEDIVRFHTSPKIKGGNGWRVCGYHYIIDRFGKVTNTVSEVNISNGVKGHNANAINICYIGGVDMSKKGLPPIDNRTPEQKAALLKVLKILKMRYPHATIYGHRDFARKACPSFDAKTEYKDL